MSERISGRVYHLPVSINTSYENQSRLGETSALQILLVENYCGEIVAALANQEDEYTLFDQGTFDVYKPRLNGGQNV